MNPPLIYALDTSMVFPAMSTYRPTPTEPWAFHEDMLHDQGDNQEWWTPVSV
jgi:hypothetical protein